MTHSLFSLKPVPQMAQILGLAGLLPFLAGGLIGWLPVDLPIKLGIAQWTSLYAALILSFLGGVRWGAAMQQDQEHALVPAVVHSLLAWSCFLLPAAPASFALAVLLIIFGIIDMRAACAHLIKSWYGHLRLWLTLGASAAMMSQAIWLAHVSIYGGR